MAHGNRWADLVGYDVDVALLQEAKRPPADWAVKVFPGDAAPWQTAGYAKREWRTAVARLSDRVELGARPTLAVHTEKEQADWTVSREGTIAAADVLTNGEVAFTTVSVYSPWDAYVRGRMWADGSAHRILSDLSFLMWSPQHRLVVAGDWNILYGYGEEGSPRWRARYQTVFDRAEALGLVFKGPQYPDGRQADPWPVELPTDSQCVPTFHHSQQTPATATRQLDFVFASRSIADRVRTRALNEPEEWGPSDHCRVLIEVDL